jgi:Ca-activated chloride channel homolog
MKRIMILILSILVLASALGLTLFTRAKKANAEVAAGNRAFAAQDYETALQHYSKAQSQVPGQAEPLYNAANVFYQQKELDKAQQSLEQALAQPRKAIEAFVHFNLGNVAYLGEQFDAAVAQYEAALRLEPADQATKYNLELALLQNQQQDQQDQQQQDQQNQQQNQQGQQDQEQNQQNQQGQQDQQQNQQGQQQDQQDQQGQQQNQQGQQPDQQGQQGQQQNQQGQQPDQQGQQQNQQGQQPDQQGQQQGQPGQPQNQQPGEPNEQAAGLQPQQGLTAQQAAQLLAAIAGNSKTLLQQLQMYYYFPGGTPEKDW